MSTEIQEQGAVLQAAVDRLLPAIQAMGADHSGRLIRMATRCPRPS